MIEITISNENSNQRLDKFLLKYLNEAPKSFIYKMLRKKNIKVNGLKAAGSEVLLPEDVITLYLSHDTIKKFTSKKEINVSAGPLDIIYEDEHILILNKPLGLLSQPDKKNQDSVVDRLLLYLNKQGSYKPDAENVFTPSIANRLDRNTTGIMLAGKNFSAMQQINLMVAENRIDKFYTALVFGKIDRPGFLEGYHVKDEHKNKVYLSEEYVEGSSAIYTAYEPLQYNDHYTLLSIKLLTGKSHQIRVHLSSMGYPIIGDYKYGCKEQNDAFKKQYSIQSQLLHASALVFGTCRGNLAYLSQKKFTAPLPPDFSKLIRRLI